MTDNFEKDINVPSKGFIVMENEFAESPVEAYETLKEQLKRKEQECEFWQHQAELGVDTTNMLTKELEEKEQECEELRGVIRKDICSHYVLGECSQGHHNNCVGRNKCIKDLEQQLDQLKAENKELKKEIHKLNSTIDFMKVTEHSAINKYNKYKQTLTEIKEIAEAESYLSPQSTRLLVHKILNKISEVIENE